MQLADSLQSLVADYYSTEDRGKAFGTLYTTGIASSYAKLEAFLQLSGFSGHCPACPMVDLVVKIL